MNADIYESFEDFQSIDPGISPMDCLGFNLPGHLTIRMPVDSTNLRITKEKYATSRLMKLGLQKDGINNVYQSEIIGINPDALHEGILVDFLLPLAQS